MERGGGGGRIDCVMLCDLKSFFETMKIYNFRGDLVKITSRVGIRKILYTHDFESGAEGGRGGG